MGYKDKLISRAKAEKDNKKQKKTEDTNDIKDVSGQDIDINLDDILSNDTQDNLEVSVGEKEGEDVKVADETFEDLFSTSTDESIPEEPDLDEIEPLEVTPPKPSKTKNSSIPTITQKTNVFSGDRKVSGGRSVELGEKLLAFAQETILLDVKENFTSDLITENAKETLITSYLKNQSPAITNYNRVLNSLVDEIMNTEYRSEIFGDLTNEVLQSVKDDLDNNGW